MNTEKKSVNRLARGTAATVMTVLFVAVVVVINVIFSMLEDKFPSLALDMTADKSYSLKKESIQVANAVTLPTEILLIGAEDAFAGEGLAQIPALAARYAAVNSLITFRYVDIEKDPTFAAKYPDLKLMEADVIVRSDKRYRFLGQESMLSTDESTGVVSSEAEVLMTTAVMAVNSDKLPLIGFVTGHDEQADVTGLKNALSLNGFECRDVNLISDDVLALTDMLVIASPVNDLTQPEIQKLDSYLENGQRLGKHLLITFDASQPETPNLSLFLKDWGIAVDTDVLYETDAQKTQGGSPLNLFGAVNSDWAPLEGLQSPCLTLASRALTTPAAPQGVTVFPLVTTYDNTAVAAPLSDDTFDPAGAQGAMQNVLLMSARASGGNTEPSTSSVTVSGSSIFFSSALLTSSSVSNLDVTLSLFREATGAEEADNPVNILPTTLVQYDLIGVSTTTGTVVGLILFSVAVPLAILLAGLAVFLRRRHL